ncbi:hypothetical protein [Nocardia sp. NBC_00416]|uniref:hypothetical protein n=1 Tax=Nocardia sp. NBC_00416 TaxID=2975991 RepID=UPI002E1CB02F
MEPLPIRIPNAAPRSAGLALVNNEAMSSTLRLWTEAAEYRELLERTRDGLIALDTDTGALYEPTREDGERLQREVDGVIARWKAERRAGHRAC